MNRVRQQNSDAIDLIIAGAAIIAYTMLLLNTVPDIGSGMVYVTFGVILGVILIGVLCAIIAHGKNRRHYIWFALGMWFSLLALIIILILPKLHDRLCPYCDEGVSWNASICPYCRKKIVLGNMA